MLTQNSLYNIKEQLIQDEGCILHAYKDTEGLDTIGIGRLIDKKGGGITQDEANFLFQNDVNTHLAQLYQKLPWIATVDEVRQCVLINIAFNIGVDSLLEFHKTLDFVRCGQFKEASEEMMQSKWAKQVGGRAVRLSKQMLTGIWQFQ